MTMTGQQRGVLAAVFASTLVSTFMGSALNLSVTDISSEFLCGATTVTWVINIFTIVTAALSVPIGHLGDVAGRRRIFLIGIALFACSCALCAVSPNVYWLIGARAIQGGASAMILAVNIPVLVNSFPPEQRGRMLGYSVTAVYVGLSIGPVVGGMLNASLGWRSIFIVTGILLALSFLLAWRFIPAHHIDEHVPQDLLGNALYVSMIAFLLVGLSLWGDGWWAKLMTGIGVVLLPCFIWRELKVAYPTVQVRLFRNDLGYTLSNVAALLNYGATFAISYMLSLYLQNVLGYSSSFAGIVLISQPVVMSFVAPFAGRLSDRIAPYKLASLGMAVITGGLFMLSTIGADTPLVLIISYQVFIGVGFGLFSSPNNNAVLSCVDRSHVGEANAILATMRTLGMSISMVIVLAILGAFVGNVVIATADPATLTNAIHFAMVVYALICVVGTLISFASRKAQRKKDDNEPSNSDNR